MFYEVTNLHSGHKISFIWHGTIDTKGMKIIILEMGVFRIHNWVVQKKEGNGEVKRILSKNTNIVLVHVSEQTYVVDSERST